MHHQNIILARGTTSNLVTAIPPRKGVVFRQFITAASELGADETATTRLVDVATIRFGYLDWRVIIVYFCLFGTVRVR
jgi:hypothetical protein